MKIPRTLIRLFLTILLVCAVTTSNVFAAPFKRTIAFQQPDGNRIELQARGDEFHATVETLDGFAVVFDAVTAAYHYATLSPDGNALRPSGVLVGQADPKRLGFKPHLRANGQAERARIRQARERLESRTHEAQRWQALKLKTAQHATGLAAAAAPAPPAQTTRGTKVGICLLVDFDDEPGSVSKDEVVRFLNGDGYTGFGNHGSVRQFFLDNSRGLLNYSNVVVGYIRIPQSLHPRSYYNNVQQEAAACASGLLQDVLLTLKTLPNYQSELLPVLSRATVDAENQIVACNLFVSGPNSGVWNRGLWGIRTSLDAPFELSPGGKQVSSFQLSPMGTELELATFCHENGHMLCGFPDLYDYDEDSSGGSGAFCLMGAGMGVPTNPAQFCAYLKQAAGWASVTELDAASELTATVAAGDGANFNHFYRYTKPGVPTEYFLIENRQQTDHDLDIPGAGIVIWHVDELGDRDDQRTNYNSTHSNYELTLVQADDQWDLENNNNTGDATDLFYAGNPSPAYSNVFSDQSAPSARWWDGSESGLLLANFSASAMDMTFKVGGLSQTAPKILGQPRNCLALMDQTASFKVTASGSNPMFYQWRCNGLNLEVNSHLIGTHAAELSISKVQAADAADYSVVVSNAFGCVTSSVASLNVIADLGAALNATELVWKTYGDGLWAPELAATHDGVTAAQTPVLNYGQSASLQTTVNGPGKLTCWWRVRSQSDTLAFYLGGFPKGKFIDGMGGTFEWRQLAVDIPKGKQVLEWRFVRDASGNYMENAAWIDEVTFLPTDSTVPVVTIKSPLANQRLSDALLTATGTARDNIRVAAVLYRLNQGPWTLAATTNHWIDWSATVNCVLGTNVFEAYALDASSNRSITANARFQYDQFIRTKGTYSGLFIASEQVPGRSGFLTLSLADKGAYSGALILPGKRYPFSGQFSLDGSSLKTVTAAPLGTLTLRLILDLADAAGKITGSVAGTTWTAGLMADRANPAANWSAYQGKYTMVLAADAQQAGLPLGYGYATASVSASGVVTLTGKLADGTAFNQTVPISLAGRWPFYCSLYNAKGSTWGWLTLEPTTPPTAIRGTLGWTQPSGGALVCVSNAFALSGAAYRPPATPAARAINLTNAFVVFDGTTVFTNALALSMPGNKFSNKSTNPLAVTLNAATGKFNGTATPPGSTQKVSFEGVLLQGQNLGAGFFLGNQKGQSQSGKVLIQQAPVPEHP